jgi:lycopene beta-cyclase
MRRKYDFIVCGNGLAGLSLVYRALHTGVWKDESILLIDKSKKQSNDRTWSFWEKSSGVFEELVYHRWKKLSFFTNDQQQIELEHLPYTYKTIKAIDFYKHVYAFLEKFKNVEWLEDTVMSVKSIDGNCTVHTEQASFHSKYVFNSLYTKPKLKAEDQYFLQHFKGITIKTDDRSFDPNHAYLMDFRTSQRNGTTFVYTLPMRKNEVFVEYTLFSKNLLKEEEYDYELKSYLNNVLKVSNYETIDSEYGVIPMTDYAFKRRSGNVINIGTAGGDTRGSTGYTFTNVQRTITKILKAFQETNSPFIKSEAIGGKEKLYDSTLLNVLAEGKYEGHQLFGDLFNGTDAKSVFSFLDGDSSIIQELRVMKSLKTWPFLKWFTKVLLRKL